MRRFLERPCAPPEDLHRITPHSVLSIIRTFKLKKSPGQDQITNRVLRGLPKKALAQLCYITRAVLETKHFPEQWKIALVVPLVKEGKDQSLSSSYRPISLLSAVSKVIEKSIYYRLLEHTLDNDILPAEQFGFLPGHNTIHQVEYN